MSLRISTFALLVIITLVCATARAADPQSYAVDFASVGDGDIDDTLKATSDLKTLRTSAPVSPYGLIARGRSDVDRLTTVLESFGYYQSAIAIKVNGLALTDPRLGDVLIALPKGEDARVAVSFTLGPLYHLGRIDIEGEIPQSVNARDRLGLLTGQTAIASNVLAGGTRLLSALREQGFAFAKVDPPVAVEAEDAPVLDVTFHVEAGQQLKIGEIHIEGLKRVHESLLRRRLLLRTGDQFRPSALEQARRDLLALNVFGQVSVQVGTETDYTGGVPITFKIRERLRHAISLKAAYSSDLGGSGGITWSDRNVFGNGEKLDLAANIINYGGSDTTGVGYDISAKFLIPEFLHRDQSVQFAIGALKQSLEAYSQTAQTAGVTLTRKLSSIWTVSAGLSTADEIVDQQAKLYTYTLIAFPLILQYDSTNLVTPLDDPRHGYRGSLSVTPTLAIDDPNATFVIMLVKLAGFFDFSSLVAEEPGRTVLALRGLAGLAQGASQYSLPPDQRFYAGGTSTVRGYAYQAVGPTFPDGQPAGGTAIAAATAEMRQRFLTNFGAAVFADAGQVTASQNVIPDKFRVGVGLGLRYYTPIGPIRVDVAMPTQKRPSDDSFEIYIGLGQAF